MDGRIEQWGKTRIGGLIFWRLWLSFWNITRLQAFMRLQFIQVLECIFAIFAIIAFGIDSVPRWELWLSCFLCLGLDTWRSLRAGEISTGFKTQWYGFTFNRDDSPMLFTCAVIFEVLLALVCFFVFLYSL